MKIFVLYFFLLSVMISSCADQGYRVADNAQTDKFASDMQSESRPKGALPSDIGLNEIALDRVNHTWKDLDAYYRQVVLLKHADKDYTDNLKNMTFFHLVEGFKMHEKADLATVEFYINEQANMPYLAQPKMLSLCLDRMKGHWDASRITQLAENVRLKQIKAVQEKFASKPDVIKRKTDEYNQYLVYAKD